MLLQTIVEKSERGTYYDDVVGLHVFSFPAARCSSVWRRHQPMFSFGSQVCYLNNTIYFIHKLCIQYNLTHLLFCFQSTKQNNIN